MSNRLSHARPSVHIDEVIASVHQHRQMVARWLAHPPSRTVQANAASTILSVIASANAAAHAAHFDTGSWRPVQAELRAAQHSHPEASTPLYFDLTPSQGRGIAKAVLAGDLVPTPLDWLPKAGTKRVCEVSVEEIQEPFVLIAECAGIETPDGVLLQLAPASQRQRARLQDLAIGRPVDASKGSRDELPTLTEDQVRASTRRRQASDRALALSASYPAALPPATQHPDTAQPSTLQESTQPVHTVEAATWRSEEVLFDEPIFSQAMFESALEDPAAQQTAPDSPIEALLQQYCADMDEEPTSQTRISDNPTNDTSLAKTEPPPPCHPTQQAPWHSPITLPPTGLVALGAQSPMPVPPARVSEPVFAPSDALPKTVPPPPMGSSVVNAPPLSAPRVKTLVSPQQNAPLRRRTRPVAETQELPDMLFANAPVGQFPHHSDVAHIAPVRQDRVTPVPTVLEIAFEKPAPKRGRRGGALLLAASIALGLFISPTPSLTPASADVAKTFGATVSSVADSALETVDEAGEELVTVKRVLQRKMRQK